MACELEYDFTYSFFYAIIFLGDTMKIAIDKNSLKAIDNENEFIYLYDNEPYKQLEKLNLHCIDYRYCHHVDINLTNWNVKCYKKAKITDEQWNVLPAVKEFKIGIIVPNYNYANWLDKCLESILNQKYKNYEIIFIDDCSTDNSVDVAKRTYKNYLLNKYGYNDDSCTLEKMKIIQLKQKRLNGGARNEAYLHLSDDVDYVYYIDSDDWLIDDDVLGDINMALQKEPDVLFVGLLASCNGKITVSKQPKYQDKYEAMEGWSGSCGKVIKKELATRQECLYDEGTLKEDKNQHCKICIYMNSFEVLDRCVYVWNRDNINSVTTIRDKATWGTSTLRHLADTEKLYLLERGKDKRIDGILQQRVQKMKDEILNNGDRQW